LSAFLSYSSTPLSQKLSYAAFVFDTLTTTKTATTPSASKAGLFFELQYNTASSTHPTLIGGKVLDHRLERSRVSSVPTGERNFHVLYYLLAGLSSAEKQHLALNNPGELSGEAGQRASGGGKRWRYLGHPSVMKTSVNDAEGFSQFKQALRKLEFPRSEIAEICQVLAVILHLGQLEFHTSQTTTPHPDESGGYSHEGGEDRTAVKNADTLLTIAAFMGVNAHDLETSLGYKTRTLHRERVTVMLDAAGAQANADELARTIYSLLVAWIFESINSRTCAVEETIANTVSIVDFPGFAPQPTSDTVLDQLLNNAATESLYNVCLRSFFERQGDLLDAEDVTVPLTTYFDNTDALKGLTKPGNGLLSILDDQARRGKTDFQFLDSLKKRFENRNPSITVGSSTAIMPGSNFPTHNAAASFSVKHFAGEVEYPVDGLMEANAEIISGDMLNLISGTRSDFIRELFGQEALNKITHPQEKTAVVQASVASKPMRMPSMARKKHDRLARMAQRAPVEDDMASEVGSRTSTMGGRSSKGDGQQGVAAQFLSSLQNITKSLVASGTNPYFVFCLKPNDRRIANQFDSKCVRAQLQTFGIAEISERLRHADFGVFMPFGEFLSLMEGDAIFIGSDREKAENVLDEKRWPENEARVGTTGVFLSERCWQSVLNISTLPVPNGGSRMLGADNDDENGGRLTPGGFGDSKSRLIASQTPSPGGFYSDDKQGGYFAGRDLDSKSDAGVSAINGDMFRNLETREQMAEKGNEAKLEVVDEHPASGSRKRWVFFVWMLTFYIPSPLIGLLGGKEMKRKDIRMAWREKLAINILIWISCAFVVFFMSMSFFLTFPGILLTMR
jgi:chitin synthase